MADIVELLNLIKTARYGRQVRAAIHDGIQQCYEDGKAGAQDLAARQLIEHAIAKNDEQEADLDTLDTRVTALEQGGGESSETTTEVPTVIFDYGYEQFSSVSYNTTESKSITFSETFTEAPVVFAAVTFRNSSNPQYAKVVAAPVNSSITTTGFNLVVGNHTASGNTVSPTVVWIAIQPTTVEVNTEIISPSGGGMTETQVRAITNPIQTTLDSIKTGYDSTVYTSPGDAVRTQVAALWAEIEDIKDRLDALEG